MDEKKVRKIVSDMLMSFSNSIVPQHRHNGVDSLQIPIGNILVLPANFNAQEKINITTNTGIPFIGSRINSNGISQYNMFILDTSGTNPLVLQPNQATFDSGGANLYFGITDFTAGNLSSTVFNRIFMNVDGAALSEEITFNATDTIGGGTNVGKLSVQAGFVDMQSDDGIADSSEAILLPSKFQLISNLGTFALQLPDASRVPTPTVGMIAFDSGDFYGCKTAGIWQKFTLV